MRAAAGFKMPRVNMEYYPFGGGLDLVTPSIAVSPGSALDATNYEPYISGGYRRLDGYERFDGRPSPTAAAYWLLACSLNVGVALGVTVTGGTSGATGVVLATAANLLVLGRVTGTFVSGESLVVAAVSVGMSTAVALQNNASTSEQHADYALLAANDQRALIQKVPGSGRVRGVWQYNDIIYAFRDNAGGTAEAMYKSTTAGWVLVALGRELAFTSGGTYQIIEGNTITGAISAATAVIARVVLQSGSWAGGDAAGYLVFASQTGTFQAENLNVGANLNVSTIAGNSAAITLLPGGRYEFDTYNFTGSTATKRLYGCDGVNNAFEFDGTTYIKIRTGMAVDTPSHLRGHRNYLFLSFRGSVQYSSIGNPYQWTVVLGAGEIALGDDVTAMIPNGGTAAGSALSIFTTSHTHTLYGSSGADFQLVASNFDMGFSPYTAQIVGNNVFGLTARGIQSLITTLTYGDFDYTSISHPVQPLMDAHRGQEIASTTIRSKNQYRLFFSDGTGLIVGLTGDKINGVTPLNYTIPVRCIATQNTSAGLENTYFGSDDGYVYQADTGTSFDGNPVEAWLRLQFNHIKSPRVRKRFIRAVLDVKIVSFCKLKFFYDLGYGTPLIAEPSIPDYNNLGGTGGYWDQFMWDQFTWDAQVVLDPQISIEGTEKNIGFVFYSNRAQDTSHTLQGITIFHIARRAER